MLEQNRSKSYHKPKSNVALLSGLLYCGNCGSFMRPKLTKRENAAGEKIYTYLCEGKERSRGKRCQSKNVNGNVLDKMICEQIKMLAEDDSEFMRGLKSLKQKIEGSREDYDCQLDAFKKELRETQEKIDDLVSSLAKTKDTPAFAYITAQINSLHEKTVKLQERIGDLESLLNNHYYADDAAQGIQELIKSFAASFDTMSVEQKRMALRSFIRKIVWDGENVHVFLFGDTQSEIDFDSLCREADKTNENEQGSGDVEPQREDRK